MRDLGLFEAYLLKLRQEKLQQSHTTLISDTSDDAARRARQLAHEAELCTRITDALRTLSNDPGQFIKEFLK